MSRSLMAVIWPVLSVNLLVSCVPVAAPPIGTPAEIKNMGPMGPAPGPAGPATGSEGTADRGGGGNLINGKPLDFYADDITKRPEYQQYIQPIDDAMKHLMGEGIDMAILKAVALRMNWYFVPIDLEKLPPSMIGVSFGTIQGARQTEREVFIDSVKYEKEDSEKKAMLLFHEIIMAYYRLKFGDVFVVCEMMENIDQAKNCRTSLTENSENRLETAEFAPLKQSEFLTAGQYADIRAVANGLFKNYKDLRPTQIIQYLNQKGFDDRLINMSTYLGKDLNRRTKSIRKRQVMDIFKMQQGTEELPRYCGFDNEFPAISHKTCDLSYSFEKDRLNLKIMITDSSGAKVEKSFSFTYNDDWNDAGSPLDTVIFRSGITYYGLGLRDANEPKGDGYFYQLHLAFVPYDEKTTELRGLSIQKWYTSSMTQVVDGKTSSYGRSQRVRVRGIEEDIRWIFTEPKIKAYKTDLGRF